MRSRLGAAMLGVLAVVLLAACGSTDTQADGKTVLRLGYFPNLTHAPAIVGVEKGFFAQELGPSVALRVHTFTAGPAAVEALFSDAIDAVYMGPNPTINAFAKSNGTAVRVISGAASGGVAFVVKPAITQPAHLKGKRVATPQLGNTQDVALRFWLTEQGLKATEEGGGDVTILPQDNSVTVDAFASGAIDGAWVPEPYASRLVAAGGRVLVDERDLWPDKHFVTTNLVVRTEFLKRHRDVVRQLLAGQVDANDFIAADPAGAQQIVSASIGKLSGKPLDHALTATAWQSLAFTNDPFPASLITGARHAEAVGMLKKTNLDGLYDSVLLNEVLAAKHKSPAVTP